MADPVHDKKIKIRCTTMTKVKKKGPGRPKKYKDLPPAKILGIQNKPKYRNNKMELIYCSPLIMKKILSFFIGQSETMQCKFKKDKVEMLCRDKYNANRIRVTMNGDKMHRYYCYDEFEYGLALTYLEPLNKKLGKQFSEFMWFSEDDEQLSKTHIWLKWMYISKGWNQNNYSLAGQYVRINEKDFDDYDEDDYPISFTLKNKLFKDIIGDAANHHGQNIYIRQNGKNAPLTIEYYPSARRYGSSNPFGDPKEIELISSLREDELFSVAISIEFLKPIASIIPTEKIHFKVSKTQPLIMLSYLDSKSIEVNILTKIVTENKT